MFRLFLKHIVRVCVCIFIMCLFSVHSTICCIICYCCLLLYLKSNRNINKNVVISDYSFQLLLYNSPGKNFTHSMCLQSPLVISVSSVLSLHPWYFQICMGYLASMKLPYPSSPKLQPSFFSWSLLRDIYSNLFPSWSWSSFWAFPFWTLCGVVAQGSY